MRRSGVVVAAAVVLLLAGCSAAPSGDPLGAAARARIRTELIDAQWAIILDNFPHASRPTVPVTHTVPDHDWPNTIVACLHGLGYQARVDGTGFTFDSFTNETDEHFRIEGYKCTAQYVEDSAVLAKLTKSQQQVYDDFLVNQVQPCLRIAGARTFIAPVGHLTGAIDWSPFDYVWLNGSATDVAYLEARCPPLPNWLDLDTRPAAPGALDRQSAPGALDRQKP